MRGDVPHVYNKRDGDASAWAFYGGRGSLIGNPFVIGPDGTREEVIAKYKAWAPKQPWFETMKRMLRGKDLVCWCHGLNEKNPLPCHLDLWIKWANE